MLTRVEGTGAAGRPRDRQRHAAVLAATREILASDGYARLTFSDVAQRAGVTRQLLHRWWSSKASLVAEALFSSPDTTWPLTYRGPLTSDLRAFLQALVDYACRADVQAGVNGLMSEAGPDTDLPGLETGLLAPLRASLAALIDQGVARGDVRADIDVTLTLNTLRGAVTMHLIADQTPPRVIVDHLTELMSWAFAAPDR